MPITGTLLEVLTAPNPRLDLSQQEGGAVTKNGDYKPLQRPHISDWDDFTFENIHAAYGHLFDIGPIVSDAINLRDSPTIILAEPSVDAVVHKWNHEICRLPLKQGALAVQQSIGLPACDVTMNHHIMPSKVLDRDGKSQMPDWCIFQRDSEQSVLVWGENKCSSKWSSNPTETTQSSNWLWPFRQVLTYCDNNSTRYAYILTPSELAAIRVYQDPSTPVSPWRVQVKFIPWSNQGNGVLTVNLAIWALTMMAVNQGHRPIRPLNWTLPLNMWWREGGSEGAITYIHHLSGRRLSQLPQGAQCSAPPDTIPETGSGASSSRSRRR